MPNHKVKAGDTIASIAAQYKITDPDTIWNHTANERLKILRKSPNLLREGDDVFLPDVKRKQESGGAEQKHKFKAKKKTAKLTIHLLDDAHKPLKNTEYTFTLKGKDPVKKSTDGSGKLEQEIPLDATEAQLKYDGNDITLKIGHLDPIDTTKGVRARLMNLGYKITKISDDDDQEFKSAVAAFKAEYLAGKKPELDDETRKKLKDVYGC